MKGDIIMKKIYEKPGLESRTFAQFENVFTACSKTMNQTPPHMAPCTYCNDYNPGVGSNLCLVCGEGPSKHSVTPPHPVEGSGS